MTLKPAKSNLIPRILSAAVLISILVVIQKIFGREGILILGVLIVALGAFEFSKLVFAKTSVSIQGQVKFIFLLTQLSALICVMTPRLVFSPIPAAILIFGVSLSFWIFHRKIEIEEFYSILTNFLLGFLYLPVLSMTALTLLHSPDGEVYFWFLIASVAMTDSGAYVTGLLWGKTKLSPDISPKKSWVGFWGGFAGAVIVAIIFVYLRPDVLQIPKALVVSLVGALASQTGDLFESLMKRRLDVKDSGNLIPGHGGILDRLDGILFAAPIFASAYLI